MSFDFGISATQSGINNWINNEFQHEANKKEREFNREMSDLEWSRSLEAWNMTNTYNSPVEQRKRLESAGLNPALMYGKSASPGIASPAPSYDAPDTGHYGKGMGIDVQTNGLSGILNAYNDLRSVSAEVAVKEEQKKLLQHQQQIANNMAWAGTWENMRNMGMSGDEWNKIIQDYRTGKPLQKWQMDMIKQYFDTQSSEFNADVKSVDSAFANEKWKLYDEQGIFLDQLTNMGKMLENRFGAGVGVVLESLLGKIKPR